MPTQMTSARRRPTTPPGGLRPISRNSDSSKSNKSPNQPTVTFRGQELHSLGKLGNGRKNANVFAEMAQSPEHANAIKSWRPPSSQNNSPTSGRSSSSGAEEMDDMSPGGRLARVRVPPHLKVGRNVVEQVSCGMNDLEAAAIRFAHSPSPNLQQYYEANRTKKNRPVHLNPGLGNFSSVVLGDDRIRMTSSFTQECDRQTKRLQGIVKRPPPTREQLILDYRDATMLVGTAYVKEMEQLMRDKLMQRTTTGPFQLRKTFKFFDRDGQGTIDLREFQAALSQLGMDFEEVQVTALYARYDANLCGQVDYRTFVAHLMEDDFRDLTQGEEGEHLRQLADFEFDLCHDSVEDEAVIDERRQKLEQLREGSFTVSPEQVEEARRIFGMIDRDNSGQINKEELGLLLLTLGKTLSDQELSDGMRRLDLDNNDVIGFDEFMLWYTDSSLLEAK